MWAHQCCSVTRIVPISAETLSLLARQNHPQNWRGSMSKAVAPATGTSSTKVDKAPAPLEW